MGNSDVIIASGHVVEPLPGGKFKVELDNGGQITAHLSGKIRKNYIKILPGDLVDIEMSPYDLTKGRITFRHKGQKSNNTQNESKSIS